MNRMTLSRQRPTTMLVPRSVHGRGQHAAVASDKRLVSTISARSDMRDLCARIHVCSKQTNPRTRTKKGHHTCGATHGAQPHVTEICLMQLVVATAWLTRANYDATSRGGGDGSNVLWSGWLAGWPADRPNRYSLTRARPCQARRQPSNALEWQLSGTLGSMPMTRRIRTHSQRASARVQTRTRARLDHQERFFVYILFILLSISLPPMHVTCGISNASREAFPSCLRGIPYRRNLERSVCVDSYRRRA